MDDPKILQQLEHFSQEEPFDFEREIQTAITAGELKQRTTEFLKKLDWAK